MPTAMPINRISTLTISDKWPNIHHDEHGGQEILPPKRIKDQMNNRRMTNTIGKSRSQKHRCTSPR